MNIKKIRHKFRIQAFLQDKSFITEVDRLLDSCNFNYEFENDPSNYLETLASWPAHVVLLEFSAKNIPFIAQIKSASPETKIILLHSKIDERQSCSLLNNFIYDCIAFPLIEEKVFLRSLDRALESNYYTYKSEQLLEDIGLIKKANNDLKPDDMYSWINRIYASSRLEDATQLFLDEVSSHYGDAEVVFFKTIKSHKTIVATQASNYDLRKPKALVLV